MVEMEREGKLNELNFRQWLDGIEVDYIWIEQTPKTFAKSWRGRVKRPDVLVPRDGSGPAAFFWQYRALSAPHAP